MDGLRYHLTLRLCAEDKRFGPGPMKLLQGVRETGSLQKAAARMGMAYSKAWKLIGRLEAEWGFKLLTRQLGGVHGGGSELTREGVDLLERYQKLLEETDHAANAAFQKYFP
ncbi:winged helix-turn-helix domain-containing protein [Agathobaculum sp.]|uniref:winged helix-turn-helix domain-containing protein n=1 Tax=Agathobaculum sp. TaxID=2048138 RepID=UPI002A821248|nr:LysR family transcriptional regulator [Agathobaculum sp.]MDY3619223.1 LysR family transcriptional regulator [Agathobaculum sp.]